MNSFRGAAPLHWTLLSKCSKTGITLQTLHPFHFDRGKILLQTPLPGIDIPNPDLITPEELTAFLAPKGAELLVRGLRDGVHRSEETTTIGLGFERPAPKITPEDRHINWNSWTAEEILRRHRVIGPLWSKASTRCPPLLSEKRIVWSSGFQPSSMALEGAVPGSATISASDPHVYIRTIDQQTLRAESLTVEGQAHHTASSAVKRADMVDLRTKYNIGSIESIKLWTPFS
ncbi:Methionyl-tRNA formyltransferase [Ptychographa xylographoides]|nr:Methionyl-tRNA formyltransferase [Ptychographa xylographoides]